MCGRFTASFEFREVKLLFNLQQTIPLTPRYNIPELTRKAIGDSRPLRARLEGICDRSEYRDELHWLEALAVLNLALHHPKKCRS